MDEAGHSTSLVFNLKKVSPYSFKCQVCSACCHNKAIGVAPYEALRLARNLKITTTEVYRAYTEEGGIILRNKPDGSCIFLDSSGCGVHPDRPLVCRLYPLGQITDSEGGVKYASMPLHPDCIGLLGTDGTVESYLESQGTRAYFEYDHVYSAVYKKIVARFPELRTAVEALENPRERLELGPSAASPGGLLSPWFDIDATVTSYCQRKGRMRPEGLDEAISLHIQALEEWIAAL